MGQGQTTPAPERLVWLLPFLLHPPLPSGIDGPRGYLLGADTGVCVLRSYLVICKCL